MMNKNSLLCKQHSPFVYIAVWFIIHCIIICAALLRGAPVINTDLFDILPPSSALRAADAADKLLSSKTSRGLYILAGHTDFETAYAAAHKLYDRFDGDQSFEELELYFDKTTAAQITEYLYTNRYQLLDKETRNLLESGNAGIAAQDALSSAFGAFTFTDLSQLQNDPFLLTERRMKSFITSAISASTSMSLKNDVLAAEYDGIWYIMLRGKLTPQASAINNTDGIIKSIYAFCAEQERMNEGISFIYSGVPFHSYESASNAQSQITIITTISIILIALLLLYVFRSIIPMIISICTITISALTAAAAVFACMGKIHILTFVFGTTLIGMGIDYSIHYFIIRRSKLEKTGYAVTAHIFKGITLGFISTEICFLLLSATPFPILRQISVFLSAGLLSSYLSVVCLYRFIPAYTGNRQTAKKITIRYPSACLKTASFFKPAKRRILLLAGIVTVSAVLIAVNHKNVKIENNIAGLYTMSDKLIHSEMVASQVLNHGSSGWYYIVIGNTQEELLYNEEQLCLRLEQEIQNGYISSYFASTLFIPSPDTQKRNIAAAAALIPLADEQLQMLGFGREEILSYKEEYYAQTRHIVSAENDMPVYLKNVINNLWIGEIDGKWYSAVMPLHTRNENIFRTIAAENETVVFVNKVADIGKELDWLTKIMLLLLLAAYIIIMFVLRIKYSMKDTMRIAVIPLFVIIATEAVLACRGISIGFFSAAALLLVFGAGIDYIIYTLESEQKHTGRVTSRAILLSYATTAMSFGALICTSFSPVHIFSITVLAGLTAAYICTSLLKNQPSGKDTETGEETDAGTAAVNTYCLPQEEVKKN